MKKIIIILSTAMIMMSAVSAEAKTTKPTPEWKPTTPSGYTPITWAKARGVASFTKAATSNGHSDYLTMIYLPYNQVNFISSSTPPVSWGPAQPPFISTTDVAVTTNTSSPLVATDTIQDWAVSRMVAEQMKIDHPDMHFFWNVPFFNITASTTDLSLSLKSTNTSGTTYITSGSRPSIDMAEDRRMLIINNNTASGQISEFDETIFTSSTLGDQAVEGFSPFTAKSDGVGVATARLFIGIKPEGKELVIYCSQSASTQEASDALLTAGVPIENQLQADGGHSAACAYNLPGQYFVEPGRTLPYLMGATPLLYRATATTKGTKVRNGPGTKFKVVGNLNKGNPLKIFQLKNGWVRISDGQEWILASSAKKI